MPTKLKGIALLVLRRMGGVSSDPAIHEESKKNKTNRSKLEVPYTCGGKNIATIIDEETRKNDGRVSSRDEVYMKTHRRKDGTTITDKAGELIRRLEELSHTEGISLKGFESSTACADQLSQVLGKELRDHVRSMGLGVTSTSLWGQHARVMTLEAENATIKDWATGLATTLEDTRATLEDTRVTLAQSVQENTHMARKMARWMAKMGCPEAMDSISYQSNPMEKVQSISRTDKNESTITDGSIGD